MSSPRSNEDEVVRQIALASIVYRRQLRQAIQSCDHSLLLSLLSTHNQGKQCPFAVLAQLAPSSDYDSDGPFRTFRLDHGTVCDCTDCDLRYTQLEAGPLAQLAKDPSEPLGPWPTPLLSGLPPSSTQSILQMQGMLVLSGVSATNTVPVIDPIQNTLPPCPTWDDAQYPISIDPMSHFIPYDYLCPCMMVCTCHIELALASTIDHDTSSSHNTYPSDIPIVCPVILALGSRHQPSITALLGRIIGMIGPLQSMTRPSDEPFRLIDHPSCKLDQKRIEYICAKVLSLITLPCHGYQAITTAITHHIKPPSLQYNPSLTFCLRGYEGRLISPASLLPYSGMDICIKLLQTNNIRIMDSTFDIAQVASNRMEKCINDTQSDLAELHRHVVNAASLKLVYGPGPNDTLPRPSPLGPTIQEMASSSSSQSVTQPLSSITAQTSSNNNNDNNIIEFVDPRTLTDEKKNSDNTPTTATTNSPNTNDNTSTHNLVTSLLPDGPLTTTLLDPSLHGYGPQITHEYWDRIFPQLPPHLTGLYGIMYSIISQDWSLFERLYNTRESLYNIIDALMTIILSDNALLISYYTIFMTNSYNILLPIAILNEDIKNATENTIITKQQLPLYILRVYSLHILSHLRVLCISLATQTLQLQFVTEAASSKSSSSSNGLSPAHMTFLWRILYLPLHLVHCNAQSIYTIRTTNKDKDNAKNKTSNATKYDINPVTATTTAQHDDTIDTNNNNKPLYVLTGTSIYGITHHPVDILLLCIRHDNSELLHQLIDIILRYMIPRVQSTYNNNNNNNNSTNANNIPELSDPATALTALHMFVPDIQLLLSTSSLLYIAATTGASRCVFMLSKLFPIWAWQQLATWAYTGAPAGGIPDLIAQGILRGLPSHPVLPSQLLISFTPVIGRAISLLLTNHDTQQQQSSCTGIPYGITDKYLTKQQPSSNNNSTTTTTTTPNILNGIHHIPLSFDPNNIQSINNILESINTNIHTQHVSCPWCYIHNQHNNTSSSSYIYHLPTNLIDIATIMGHSSVVVALIGLSLAIRSHFSGPKSTIKDPANYFGRETKTGSCLCQNHQLIDDIEKNPVLYIALRFLSSPLLMKSPRTEYKASTVYISSYTLSILCDNPQVMDMHRLAQFPDDTRDTTCHGNATHSISPLIAAIGTPSTIMLRTMIVLIRQRLSRLVTQVIPRAVHNIDLTSYSAQLMTHFSQQAVPPPIITSAFSKLALSQWTQPHMTLVTHSFLTSYHSTLIDYIIYDIISDECNYIYELYNINPLHRFDISHNIKPAPLLIPWKAKTSTTEKDTEQQKGDIEHQHFLSRMAWERQTRIQSQNDIAQNEHRGPNYYEVLTPVLEIALSTRSPLVLYQLLRIINPLTDYDSILQHIHNYIIIDKTQTTLIYRYTPFITHDNALLGINSLNIDNNNNSDNNTTTTTTTTTTTLSHYDITILQSIATINKLTFAVQLHAKGTNDIYSPWWFGLYNHCNVGISVKTDYICNEASVPSNDDSSSPYSPYSKDPIMDITNISSIINTRGEPLQRYIHRNGLFTTRPSTRYHSFATQTDNIKTTIHINDALTAAMIHTLYAKIYAISPQEGARHIMALAPTTMPYVSPALIFSRLLSSRDTWLFDIINGYHILTSLAGPLGIVEVPPASSLSPSSSSSSSSVSSTGDNNNNNNNNNQPTLDIFPFLNQKHDLSLIQSSSDQLDEYLSASPDSEQSTFASNLVNGITYSYNIAQQIAQRMLSLNDE